MTTIYRKANVSARKAVAEIYEAFPTSDIESFSTVKANALQAQQANTTVGEKIYAATLKVSEFPPSDEDSSDDADSDPKPEPPKDDKPSEDKEEDSSDDSADDALEPSGDGEGADDGELHKPKELSPDEKIIHLLSEILDAVKGGGPGDLAGGDLPDIGGPDQGAPLPPPPHGGPGAGLGAPKPPLPPPASPHMGPGAFSHYDPKAKQFSVIRRNAGEIGTRGLIAEAQVVYPTHRVAKVNRTGTAEIGGLNVNLAQSGVAVITLVAKN